MLREGMFRLFVISTELYNLCAGTRSIELSADTSLTPTNARARQCHSNANTYLLAPEHAGCRLHWLGGGCGHLQVVRVPLACETPPPRWRHCARRWHHKQRESHWVRCAVLA